MPNLTHYIETVTTYMLPQYGFISNINITNGSASLLETNTVYFSGASSATLTFDFTIKEDAVLLVGASHFNANESSISVTVTDSLNTYTYSMSATMSAFSPPCLILSGSQKSLSVNVTGTGILYIIGGSY